MENVKNVNKYNSSQLEIKQEIRETIGKNSNSNVNEKSDDEKIREAREKYYEKKFKKEEKKQEEKKQEEESLKKLRVNEPEGFELNTEKANENKEKEFDKYSGGYIKTLFPSGNKYLPVEYKDLENLVSELKSKLNFIMSKYENKFPHEHEIKSSNEEDEILKYKKYGEADKVLNELMKKCESIINLKFNAWDLEHSQIYAPNPIPWSTESFYSPNAIRIMKDAALFSLRYAYLLQMHCKMLEKIVEVIENNVEYYSSKVDSKDLWFYGNLFNIYYKTFIKLYRNFLYENFFDDVPEIIEEKWNSFNEVIEKIKNGTQFNKSVKTKNLLENEEKRKREEKLKEFAENLEEMEVEFEPEGKKRLPGAPSEIYDLKYRINYLYPDLVRNVECFNKYINEVEIKSSNEEDEILKYEKYSEAAKVLNELMEKCKKVVELSIKDSEMSGYTYYQGINDERFKHIRKFLYAYEWLLQKHSEIIVKVINLIKNNLSYYSTKRNFKDLGFFGDLFNIYYEKFIKIYEDFSNYIPTVFKENWEDFNETIEKIKKEIKLYNGISSMSKLIPFNHKVKYKNKKYDVLKKYGKYAEAEEYLNKLMKKCKDVKKSENYLCVLEKHFEGLEKLREIINSNEEYYFSKLKSENLESFADLFNVYYKFYIGLYENFLNSPIEEEDLFLNKNWEDFNETIEKIKKEIKLYNGIFSISKFIPFNHKVEYKNTKYNVLNYKTYAEAEEYLNELMKKCKDVKKSENYLCVLEEHFEGVEKLCKIINSDEEYYFSKLKSENLESFADLFNVYYKFYISLYENFLKDSPVKKKDLFLDKDWEYFNETIKYENYLNNISTKINLDLNDKEKLKSFNGLKVEGIRGIIKENCDNINKRVDAAKSIDNFYEEKPEVYLEKRKKKIGFLVKMLKQNKYDIKKDNKFNFNIYKKNLEFTSVADIFKYVSNLHGKVIEKFRILKEELKKEEEELKRNPEDTLIKSEKLTKSAVVVFRELFREILKKESGYLDILYTIENYMNKLKDKEADLYERYKREKSDYEKIFKKDFEDAFIKYSMLNIVNLYENFLTYDPIKYPNEFGEYSKELFTLTKFESEEILNDLNRKYIW